MLLKQRVVVDSAVLFSSVLGADTMRGCARHAGVWTAPPVHTPTQTQVSMVDGPLAGNGLLGLTTAPHSESWPPSPPNETHFGKQTLWIGSNSFWSANTYEPLHVATLCTAPGAGESAVVPGNTSALSQQPLTHVPAGHTPCTRRTGRRLTRWRTWT